MKAPGKICWIILSLFMIGNLVLWGYWWKDRQAYLQKNIEKIESRRHPQKEDVRNHYKKKLGFSDEKYDRMMNLWGEHRRELREHEIQIDSLRKELIELTFSDIKQEEREEELIDQLVMQQRLIEKSNVEHFGKLREVAETEEEKERLDKMFRTFMDRKGFSQRRGGRQHREKRR